MKYPVIYGLCDPTNGELRYIGKTVQTLSKRRRGHLTEKGHSHKINWVKKLPAPPDVITIERCVDGDWPDRERYWIAFFKAAGARLVNQREGGYGGRGAGPDALKVISEKLRGRKRGPRSAEIKLKISLSRRGKGKASRGPMSAETRNKIRLAHLGKASPLRGYMQSPEHVRKRMATKKLNAPHRDRSNYRTRRGHFHQNSRPVYCPQLDLFFDSGFDFAKFVGVNPETVSRYIKFGIHYYKKYSVVYADGKGKTHELVGSIS